MTINNLLALGVTEEQAKKIIEIYVTDFNVAIKKDYLAFYKYLKMKLRTEEYMLETYCLELNAIANTKDVAKRKEVEGKARVQKYFVERLKEYFIGYERLLQDYAKTFNDVESKVFVLSFFKGFTIRDVADATGLSEPRIKQIKRALKRGLKEIIIPTIK